MNFDNERLVDAIEEGKIVSVSEDYAKREGLTILRKHEPKNFLEREKQSQSEISPKTRIEGRSYKKGILSFEELRKPLDWRKNQIVQELAEDFHWIITKARRERNMTRKQLANAIHESEDTVKKLENGIMPVNDFVLVNKIQDFLNINLRKDGQNFNQSARMQLESERKIKEKLEIIEENEDINQIDDKSFTGSDIEIVDDK
jgi:ribosome-binding protein aMBF1 (putative translation factor)